MGKTSRFGPLLGVVFAVLLFLAANVGSTPDTDKPAKWADFYSKHSNQVQVLVSAYLFILAGLALLGFLCVLRTRMDGKMPAFAFVSGAVAAGGLCITGGLYGGVAGDILFGNTHVVPSAELADYLTSTAFGVFLASSMLPLAFSLLSLGMAAIRTRVLSLWIGWFAVVTGVVTLFSVLWLPLVVLLAFLLVVGVALTVQKPKESAATPAGAV